MAINPSELSAEAIAVLGELAEESGKKGKDLTTILRETVEALKRSPSQEEDDGLDTEFMDWCADQVRGKEVISLEEARRILSHCSGSLAADIIEDRGDR